MPLISSLSLFMACGDVDRCATRSSLGGQGAVAFVFLLFWDYDRLLDHAIIEIHVTGIRGKLVNIRLKSQKRI
ncbi:hypothetical protein Tco_0864253 [Tanacetum coccineum]